MADLIDRGTLAASLFPLYNKDAADIYRIIEDAPAVEAEPVRHGKLLEGETFNDQHCSVCGQVFRDDISFIIQPDETGCHMPKRCPECGCYWDGGADNG